MKLPAWALAPFAHRAAVTALTTLIALAAFAALTVSAQPEAGCDVAGHGRARPVYGLAPHDPAAPAPAAPMASTAQPPTLSPARQASLRGMQPGS